MHPPTTRSQHHDRLSVLVELRSHGRAALHALVEEILKTHAGARLKTVLALHGGKVNRVELHGNADGRAGVSRRWSENDQERRLARCRVIRHREPATRQLMV